jgi:O-antigen chain-terminating methyltransferase
MVRQCQEFGLDVTESEMIEYLRNQQPNSFGALTGFHILEHLPFKTVISLFDEALRVLKSGGMVIFETPNPENLIVAACNFYFDPTHRNPLPPRLLNFLIESRGFGKTEIIRLHPSEFFREEQKTSPAVEALISLFNMEQDYSVIAYKR